MKKKIHPKYVEATVTCGCGETFKTRSTKEKIMVGICSKCHPFFTGKQKFVDTAGQVEKFQKKFQWTGEKVVDVEKKILTESRKAVSEHKRSVTQHKLKQDEAKARFKKAGITGEAKAEDKAKVKAGAGSRKGSDAKAPGEAQPPADKAKAKPAKAAAGPASETKTGR